MIDSISTTDEVRRMASELSDLRIINGELIEAMQEVINSNPSILATDRNSLRFVQAITNARAIIEKATMVGSKHE